MKQNSLNTFSCVLDALQSITYEYHKIIRGDRGHDRMVVGFTTTCAISAYRQ
jgi:hypothetical protein